jgi:hypothetical protein
MRKGFEGLSALVGSVLKEEVKAGRSLPLVIPRPPHLVRPFDLHKSPIRWRSARGRQASTFSMQLLSSEMSDYSR